MFDANDNLCSPFNDSVPFTVASIFFLMLVVIWSIETISDSGLQGKIKHIRAGYTVIEVSPATRTTFKGIF
jgi:hypothetical protein